MSHVEHIAFCVKFKDCVTARYKHNIRTLTRNRKFIGTRLETERKPYQRVEFLPVSTAPHTDFMFVDSVRILSISVIMFYIGVHKSMNTYLEHTDSHQL